MVAKKLLLNLEKYHRLAELERLIAMPLSYIGQPVKFVVPSIELKSDGPALTALYLITPDFVCEIGILGKPFEARFDVVKRSSVRVYFELATHEIGQEAGSAKSFSVATVHVDHLSTQGFRSTLTYTGDASGRTEWLKTVQSAFPVTTIL